MYDFFYFEKNSSGDIVKNTKYERIADFHKAPENRFRNAIVAFLSGGVMGFLGEGVIEILCSIDLDRVEASTYMILIFIFLASLFTALGFFDKLVTIFKCGLIIPITGFAHSMTSSSLDYKKEGPIYGIGSNMFKLAGSVLLYGVLSAWCLAGMRYLLGVIG